jgi:hypothetical protein
VGAKNANRAVGESWAYDEHLREQVRASLGEGQVSNEAFLGEVAD